MKLPNRIVILNDLHIPYQDNYAVSIALSHIKKTKPDVIVLNGDMMDCFKLSSFDKSPFSGESFNEELRQTRIFLEQLRKISPNSIIYYISGNHEHRLKSYITKYAPNISAIGALKIQHLLNLKDLNIIYIENKSDNWIDTYIKIGNWYIGHFDKVSTQSGATARSLVEKYGANIIQAHTHRGGVYYKRLISGEVLHGVENYCLCDLNPPFDKTPNWQQGFSELINENDILCVHFHEIVR